MLETENGFVFEESQLIKLMAMARRYNLATGGNVSAVGLDDAVKVMLTVLDTALPSVSDDKSGRSTLTVNGKRIDLIPR